MPRKKIKEDSTTPTEPTPEPVVEAPVAAAPAPDSAAEAAPAETKPRRGLRRKKAADELSVAPVEAEAPAEVAPEAAVQEEKPKQRGRARGGKTPRKEKAPVEAAEPGEEVLDEAFFAQFDLPMPIWRPKSESAPAPKAAEHREDSGQGDKGNRRGRNRRRGNREDRVGVTSEVSEEPTEQPVERERRGRGGRRTAESPKPVPQAVVVVPEPPPARPVRPVINIPEDAPQVILRERIPTLVRNHRVYPPMAFFGHASDAQRAKTVIDEMKMAGEAGVHIHSHLVEFEVDPRNVEASVTFAAYMLAKSIEADPDAQVLFRIVFIAPAGWQEDYPAARYITAEGALAEPSVCDDAFWNKAKDCLTEFIKLLRMLDAKDHILGVHLERGEWFYAQGWGYDTSSAAKEKFRDWARTRYRNDIVALRAAWFDGSVNFNSLSIPEYKGDESGKEKFIRSSRKERRWVDYHLFLSDATVERIGELAYGAKEASDGYFLVGASYGYTFEWSHPASGHLSLGKLLRTPEIDFIAGPPSYTTRQPGGAAPFPGPIDSFALNGKLYISEEDFKTSIGGRQEPDDYNPVIKTPQALESAHWRGVGSALAHASGVCWMDLWGNGWLNTPSIWDRSKRVLDCLVKRMAAPMADPDVAVFIDERALAYLVDEQAFAVLVQNVRESILRSGLSAAFYLLSDLQHREKFPESKLYVFLNAWDVRPDLRAAIKSRLQRDNKVLLWIYGAGLFDSGRDSLERAREVTGIALKPQPFHSKAGTSILNRRHPLCEAFPEKGIVSGVRLDPSYFAIPEDAQVLGEYTQTGLPSFVVKESTNEKDSKQSWKSVFLGEPVVTPAFLRALGQMAGAHVWNYQEDVVHVRPPFLTVHCTGTGPRTITLPRDWAAYNLGADQWAPMDSSSLKFHGNDGTTHVFLAGPKEELDALLSADPTQLLHMEELPVQSDDTVRFDAATFDVPIMKLGEWMEGSETEELSDELLFRPRFIEEPEAEEESSDRRGRRRRRGRGGRDRGGSEETASVRRDGESAASFAEDDLDMNVVFRRRK